jgi:hypothetical protein
MNMLNSCAVGAANKGRGMSATLARTREKVAEKELICLKVKKQKKK